MVQVSSPRPLPHSHSKVSKSESPRRDRGESLLRSEGFLDVLREVARFFDRFADGFGVSVDLEGDFVGFLSVAVRSSQKLFPITPTTRRIRDEIALKLLEILSSSVSTDRSNHGLVSLESDNAFVPLSTRTCMEYTRGFSSTGK